MDRIAAEKVGKRFGPYTILKDISFEVKKGDSLCLWGPNGSGKSTLLKIVAGLIRPTKGKIEYSADGHSGPPSAFKNRIGMVSPDVKLYEELTPDENLEFIASSRGIKRNKEYEKELLRLFFPEGVKNEPIGLFSSGMKQRINITAALAHGPDVLLLDEATSYLDTAGKAAAAELILSLKKNTALVVATNDPAEKLWCGETIDLRGENLGRP